MTSQTRIRIIHSLPKWQLSGVCTWITELWQQLDRYGVDQSLLLTGQRDSLGNDPIPLYIKCFRLGDHCLTSLPEEYWWRTQQYLNSQAPCVYLPNFDFDRSVVIGGLSPRVAVVPVLHSDEHCYYDFVKRQVGNVDSIVSVSQRIQERCSVDPRLAGERLSCIPYGVSINPQSLISRGVSGAGPAISLLYSNRLSQYQKRIFNLIPILLELRSLTDQFVLHVAGDGPDRDQFFLELQNAGLSAFVVDHGRLSREDLLRLMGTVDVFLLCSEFEGLPLSLLEAMASGLVPVVYHIESGVDEVIVHADNGFIIQQRQPRSFALHLYQLSLDRSRLARMGARARAMVISRFTVERMGLEYYNLLSQSFLRATNGLCLKRNPCWIVPDDLRLSSRYRVLKNRLRRKLLASVGISPAR